jgi:hypothetical protein
MNHIDYVKIVNCTGEDIRGFEAALLEAVDAGELPKDLRDVFALEITCDSQGRPRGILRMA